jgi:hypothetical protein
MVEVVTIEQILYSRKVMVDILLQEGQSLLEQEKGIFT